jgi:dienelactone hydrolase
MKSLEDYDIRDVADYLRDWGYIVTQPQWMSPEQLADIERLIAGGQQEATQNDLFNLLGKTLNRSMA